MTAETTYTGGTSTALVGPECVVLLPADGPVVTALWPLVRSGAGLDAVLEVLAARGLRSLPPFALLHGETLVLRGEARARLAGGAEVDGAASRIWLEHPVTAGDTVTLLLGSPVGAADPLPIVAGVVRAAAVTVPVVPASGTATEPAGEPDAEAVHEHEPVQLAGPPPVPVPIQVPEPRALPDPEPMPEPIEPVVAAEPEPDPEPEPEPVVEIEAVEPPAPAPVTAEHRVSSPTAWPTSTWATSSVVGGAGEGVVDGVPDFGAPALAAPVEDSYDHLFGTTIHRHLDDAAVREPEVDESVAAAPAPAPGSDPDHDGMTVSRAVLRGAQAAAQSGRTPGGAPQVLGVVCACGRANRPDGRSCAACGRPLPDTDPQSVDRPVLGTLRASDGSSAPVDRTVLIGRQPTASRFSSDDAPHILRVGADAADISRTHVEVRVEEWDVLVVDRSANGTWLRRPGTDPRKLHKDEPVLVLPGCVLDLGDGITISFDGPAA